MSLVEFDLFRVNNKLCVFSKSGKFLAIAYQTNLIIKNSKTCETIHSFIFSDIIEYIEWSQNNEFILCTNIKKATIQIYSIYYPEWKYKLTEGSAGLESVSWSPDSKHILTLSDFNIQISIWSLENRNVIHLQNIKSIADILHFSPDNDKLAIVVSVDGQDNIEIYKTSTWKLNQKLICGRVSSIDGICWSPNSEWLCIWSSHSDKIKLIIYSNILERDVAVFHPSQTINLFDIACHNHNGLKGIENVNWIPNGQLLAVTGFNEMILLLNCVTWKPLLQLYLQPVIKENYLHKVYEERIIHAGNPNKSTHFCDTHILEEKSERPINIRIGRKNDIDKLSIAKFDILEFSPCGQYLAVKHQLYPTTLWIWNIIEDYLDYLILRNTIMGVKWNPTRTHLFIFCECPHMFEWTPQSASCVSTPRNITVLDGQWHPEGNLLLLYGYNKAIIYETENK